LWLVKFQIPYLHNKIKFEKYPHGDLAMEGSCPHHCDGSEFTIAVGSLNPVKLRAATEGAQRVLSNRASHQGGSPVLVKSQGYNVPSGVNDQPFGDDETLRGAKNRAVAAFLAHVKSNGGARPLVSIGLEGGVDHMPATSDSEAGALRELQTFAWIAVYDGKHFGVSRTGTLHLPQRISELVLGGMELGAADDLVFGTTNSKQAQGAVGALTRGLISRTDYYVPAVVLALVPFQWEDMYFTTAASSPTSPLG
jgi:inosine/xanthosine triphosphatase